MKRYNSILKEEDMQKLKDHFKKRTNKHIELVQQQGNIIIESGILSDEDNKTLKKEIAIHDASKFKAPEYEPYLHVNWKYKMRAEGKEYEVSKEIEDQMNEATHHHVKKNSHHPEYWSDQDQEIINKNNRDEPPKEIIEAEKMPDAHIAHMVADWMAMSIEKGITPYPWAKKNINVRWKFTEKQVELIYNILDTCWKK
jgi:hypothetical protein